MHVDKIVMYHSSSWLAWHAYLHLKASAKKKYACIYTNMGRPKKIQSSKFTKRLPSQSQNPTISSFLLTCLHDMMMMMIITPVQGWFLLACLLGLSSRYHLLYFIQKGENAHTAGFFYLSASNEEINLYFLFCIISFVECCVCFSSNILI